MPYGLGKSTIRKIAHVFESYENVDKVILYGSRAKGNYNPGSDIDMTIKGIGLNLALLNRISLDLDDLLLPYSFDISLFHQISNNDLIEHIKRIGIVFYKRNAK